MSQTTRRSAERYSRRISFSHLTFMTLLLLTLSAVLPALAADSEESVELHTGSPDFFVQATADGVPPDFLSARSVSARIVQYNRPLVDMLSEAEGRLTYKVLKNGHALHRSYYSATDNRINEVEYRFIYHPETKENELTDILVNGKLLDNYDFYNYADELCRPKRP